MYKVVLYELEKEISFKELENYELAFLYIKKLIRQLEKNKVIIIYKKKNKQWIKSGQWKIL